MQMPPPAMLTDLDNELSLSSQTFCATPRVKVINDPIHGHFEIPPHVLAVTDTPHVQRLRDLKQLGGTYLVFPGASHNRFEHSLGVSHLSGLFVNTLYNNPRDPTARLHFENERHMRTATSLVELAGLVHDLGHGPFSHLFDHEFLPAIAQRKNIPTCMMQHEARSVRLFEHCIDSYSLDVDREHVNVIGDLICGSPQNGRSYSSLAPRFLFQVVSNSVSGVDTDKFDYLSRDLYNVGTQRGHAFDHERLMKFAKIIDDNICFHRKELFNVYNLFLTRFQLHRLVYNHRAALSLDAMLTDALLYADEALDIAESVYSPADFLHMTDSIVPVIERSKDPMLKDARHVLHRIRRRQLYRFVDEHLMPADRSVSISPEDVTTCQDSGHTGVTLKPDDVHIKMVTLNFGMKEHNPVDKVQFFNFWEDTSPFHIPSNKASYVMPTHFQEKIARIYLKREAEGEELTQLRNAVGIAFRNFLKRSDLVGVDDDHHGYGGMTPPKDSSEATAAKRDRTQMNGELKKQLWACNGAENGTNGGVDSPNQRLAKRERQSVG